MWGELWHCRLGILAKRTRACYSVMAKLTQGHHGRAEFEASFEEPAGAWRAGGGVRATCGRNNGGREEQAGHMSISGHRGGSHMLMVASVTSWKSIILPGRVCEEERDSKHGAVGTTAACLHASRAEAPSFYQGRVFGSQEI